MNSGGRRRHVRQASSQDHWGRVTLDKHGEDRSRANQKARGPASFVRMVPRMLLADLANAEPDVQLNLHFR